MRARALAVLAVALAVAMAGCAQRPSAWDKARAIKAGMSKAEVEALLGPPRTGYVVGSTSSSTWVSGGPRDYRTVTMRFEHGVLVTDPHANPPYR